VSQAGCGPEPGCGPVWRDRLTTVGLRFFVTDTYLHSCSSVNMCALWAPSVRSSTPLRVVGKTLTISTLFLQIPFHTLKMVGATLQWARAT